MSEQPTQTERDLYVLALDIQSEIKELEHAMIVSKAKIDALKPQFHIMKNFFIKNGKYKESDFKRGA